MNGRLSLRYALTLFFFNRRVIIACLLAGALGGLSAALLTPRRYTAEALLLLNPESENSQRSLTGLASALPFESFFTRMIESDVQIIKSDPVLRDAVQRMGSTGPESVDRSVEQLQGRLQVKVQADSNIIRISYTDVDRSRAVKTVDAIIQSYGQKRSGAYVSGNSGAQQKEVNDLAEKLRVIDGQIRDVQTNADVLNIAQDVQIAGNRLDDVTERAKQAHQRLNAVKAELGEVGAELGRTPSAVVDSRESSSAKVNDEAHNTLARLQLERQRIAEQYRADWPGLRDIDERIAAAKLQVAASDRTFSVAERRVRNPVVNQILGKSTDLRIERASLVAQTAQLDAEARNARARVAIVRNAQHDLAELQRRQEVMENLFKSLTINSVGSQLHDRELDRKGAGIRVLQPASAPVRPSGHAGLLFVAGVLLGIAAAMAATILATMLRQEFITPDEAAGTLQLPLLGVVSEEALSFESEQDCESVRALAERIHDTLIDNVPLRSLRIAPDHARSIDARNVTRCIATLLVADGRSSVLVIDDAIDERPLVSDGFGNPRSIDFGSGDIEFVEQDAFGVWTPSAKARARLSAANPAEIKAFLQRATEHFAYVLILGDPVQRASRSIYQVVDANLILIREGQTRAPVARQLRETILAAGGNIVGFAYLGRRLHIPEKVYRWL